MSKAEKSSLPVKTRNSKPRKIVQMYPDDFAGLEPPQQLWRSRRIGEKEYIIGKRNPQKVTGKLHLCGRGSKTAEVMFVSPAVLRDEEWASWSSDPIMLKGSAGNLFLRNLGRCGFDEGSWYYTALCKYSVPTKPTTQDIRWNQAILEDEIRTIKPKLIVCLGKLPFDHLYKLKFDLRDVQGGFFRSDHYDCLLYPMDSIATPRNKPEYLERFIFDLREVRKMLDECRGVQVVKITTSYFTLEKAEHLQGWVDHMLDVKPHFMGVDCEWHGRTYVDGLLRSAQFAWKPGGAVYLKFMGENLDYTFDQPMHVAAQIAAPLLNHKDLKFVGHQAAADAVWLKHRLGVNVEERFAFDTLYAVQCLNEYADLKLERNAMAYTDLGRYDIDLTVWKKLSGWDEEENNGYGRVPDKIIIPYGLRDVDATLRLFPIFNQKLAQQGLFEYYYKFQLPFVTDGFVEMMETGLPINLNYLDSMRETFARNYDALMLMFRQALRNEANLVLCHKMSSISPDGFFLFQEIFQLMQQHRGTEEWPAMMDYIRNKFKSFVGVDRVNDMLPVLEHWLAADSFNVVSVDHLRRWIFNVKGFRPIKTTKKDGITMAWDKVMALPPEQQGQYTPAADKQTIKLFATKDPMIAQLEELKAVGNILKAFLKSSICAKCGEEKCNHTDSPRIEQGIHKWIQSDGAVHANFALTETGRPRAWHPNILNWPKAITKPLENAFERINKHFAATARVDMAAKGYSEEEIAKHVELLIRKPVSLRSCVEAPEGWCLIDMDLKTAEVVALGYLSGDKNMINVLTEPDRQFARISQEDPKKVVRIAYNENSCYPESEWDPALLTPLSDPRILRNELNEIIHPKRDLHWEMGEGVELRPREKCDERASRDGCGKVGNFSIPYGATDTLLERMIEANTGSKPKEGTGQRMIETYATRYPVADRFLKRMEERVSDPGYYRAVSGRLRHFFVTELADVADISDYTMEGILSPLKRQARNFPMQNLVADTTNRALRLFREQRRKMGLHSRIFMLLYDAVCALAPLEEAKETATLLKRCLTEWNTWTVNGVTFNFEVDISYGFQWGTKPSKEQKKILSQYV